MKVQVIFSYVPPELRDEKFKYYDYIMRFSEFSDNKVLPFFNTNGKELERLFFDAKPQVIRSIVLNRGDKKFLIAELAMEFARTCTFDLNIPLMEGIGVHLSPENDLYNLYFKESYIRKPRWI